MDKSVRVWDLPTLTQLHHLVGHSARVYALLAFWPRKLLASACDNGAIVVWSATTGEKLHTLFADGAVRVLAFEPHLPRVVAGTSDGRILRWDAVTGDLLASWGGHNSFVNGLAAFSLGNRTVLASASQDCSIKFWDLPLRHPEGDVELGATLHKIELTNVPMDVAVSENGRLMAIVTAVGLLAEWEC